MLLGGVASSHDKVQRPLPEYELLQVQASCRTSRLGKQKFAMSACHCWKELFPILSINSCYSCHVTLRSQVVHRHGARTLWAPLDCWKASAESEPEMPHFECSLAHRASNLATSYESLLTCDSYDSLVVLRVFV